MTTLDYTAYPHILDIVLSDAPWKALLGFRSTSTLFRNKIDEVLAKHLVFEPSRPRHPRGFVVSGTNGRRHPAFAYWSAEFRALRGDTGEEEDDDNDVQEEVERKPDPPVLASARAHSVKLFGAARAFDLCEMVPHKGHADLLRSGDQPRTVRLRRNVFHPQTSLLTAPHRVIFARFMDNDGYVGHLGTVVGDITKRFVTRVCIPSVHPLVRGCSSSWDLDRQTKRLVHLVLILVPGAPVEHPPPDSGLDSRGPYHVLLGISLDLLRLLRDGAAVTIVGAQDFPSEAYDLPGGLDGETLVKRLRERMINRHPSEPVYRDDPDGIGKRLHERVRFLSQAEYKAKIPLDQWELEMTEEVTEFPGPFPASCTR